MKVLVLLLSVILMFAFVGCGDSQENETVPQDQMENMMGADQHTVKVNEKMDAGSYSYLNVTEGENSYWIAVPKMEVQSGEVLYYSKFMEMKNFRSESLDRTFESVLFVEDASKDGVVESMNPHQSELSAIQKETISVQKASGGYTVDELYKKKDQLVNKKVKVRGKVVKANLGIMNKNWFHIQDGTGDKNTFDLTVTSNDVATVGNIVLIEGILIKDKDFGSGYSYSLILENSKIKVE